MGHALVGEVIEAQQPLLPRLTFFDKHAYRKAISTSSHHSIAPAIASKLDKPSPKLWGRPQRRVPENVSDDTSPGMQMDLLVNIARLGGEEMDPS